VATERRADRSPLAVPNIAPGAGLHPTGRDTALILVADDVQANVDLLLDQLGALGFRTVAAHDGPSALAAAFHYRPDLCVLDVTMPAGDLGCDDGSAGFEVCRRIKRDPRTARIPVVFVTALNDSTARVRAIEAGGDDFLNKPPDPLVLSARVRSLLKLKAIADALDDSVRRLRELEQTRDDLMKMVVHDLKTPLTSVLATLELLIDGDFGPLSVTQRQVIADAEAKAEDLLRMIGDLLEISKLEVPTIPLRVERVAPAALLGEVIHDWSVRFRQERALATIDVADDAGVFEADRALLKRVFANLVQNALTHSPTPITLRLSARGDPGGIVFTVADNGPGIPPAYHDAIFRKFEQAPAAGRAPGARGRSSGLGLAFCRLVVERHGGRIWVDSTPGAGSAFHILMPTTAPPQ